MDFFPFLLIGSSALLNTIAQISLKMGLNQIPDLPFVQWILRCAQSFFILGGIMSYSTSLLLWLLALTRVEMGYGLSLLSVSYILTVLAGSVLLKEPLSGLRLLGVILISGGIYCVSQSATS